MPDNLANTEEISKPSEHNCEKEFLEKWMGCEKCLHKKWLYERYKKAGLCHAHILFMPSAKLEPPLKKIRDEFDCSHPKNYLLMGEPGRGKTHLAVTMVKKALMYGRNAHFLSVPQWLMEMRDRFGEADHWEMVPEIERLVNKEILVMDDLGANRATEWAVETLYCVLARRENEMRDGLIITTNLSVQEITDNYGARVMSRLERNTRQIKLTGPDRRLYQGKEKE